MEKKETKIYIQPMTEIFLAKSSHLILTSFGGDAGGAEDGGTIGVPESKVFDSWEFHDRLDIPSNKLDNTLSN